MIKKILFFIVIFYLSTILSKSWADIIPLKKPIQTKEETAKKLLSDILIPLPKPIKKKETQQDNDEKLTPKKISDSFILPKKKPLIAGSKKKPDIKISKYYNKKDFSLAKKAISEMKKGNWPLALKTAKKAKDKSIYNFIQWRHLLTKGNKASFYDYKLFISANEDYPRIGRVKYLAEHKLSTDKISPKKIRSIMNTIMLDFFDSSLKTGDNFKPDTYEKMYDDVTHYVY